MAVKFYRVEAEAALGVSKKVSCLYLCLLLELHYFSAHIDSHCKNTTLHHEFQYEVTAVPTIIFLDTNGSIVDRIDGGEDVAKVTQCFARLVNSSSYESPLEPAPSAAEAEQSKTSALHARLKSLITSSPIMVFIKGSPSEPRCGFSRQACEILTSHNLHFGYFDILNDDEVRQGLKEYSDWPTYPQLYVRGELMGGLDIMKEMVDNGDFVEQLDVQEFVAKAGESISGGDAAASSESSLNQKLHQLVNRHRIMLFMKGIPSSPRCGFSRQIVEILDSFNISYDAFNILEDEEVRQGLKEFSDWPTYPQLYVEGDLVGGLDIVKEMQESGDLKGLLNGDMKD